MRLTRLFATLAILLMVIGVEAARGAALHDAAAAGATAKAKQLIKDGADVNERNENAQTPLHIAAARGDEAMARLLLESGASPNAGDNHDRTPLHEAAAAGNPGVVSLLVNNGSYIDSYADASITPLSLACYLGNREIVTILLDNGADPNNTGYFHNSKSPLRIASERGFPEIADILIAHGAYDYDDEIVLDEMPLEAAPDEGYMVEEYPFEDGEEAYYPEDATEDVYFASAEDELFYAVRNNDAATVRRLIFGDVNVNAVEPNGLSPLHLAAFFNEAEIMEILISNGADMGANLYYGETPLHWAAWNESVEAIDILIDNGAAVNARDNSGQTPLDDALEMNRQKAADALRRRGGETGGPAPDSGLYEESPADLEYTDLYDAVLAGDAAAVRRFIGQGADVDAPGPSMWWMPLHAAARFNYTEIVEILIDAGADVNMQPEDAYTPLQIAAYWGSRATGRLLMDAGANTDAFIAAGLNDTDMLAGFLDSGTDVNLADMDGETLLYWAASAGAYDTAALLLERGANPSRTNNSGGSPRDVAESRGFYEIAGLMGAEQSGDTELSGGETLIDAVMVMSDGGDIERVRAFLREGADVNAVGIYDETALFWAVRNNLYGIAELLISNGARVNVKNSDGATPLHVAAFWGFTDLIALLLDNGANANTEDNNGDTPLDWASDENTRAFLQGRGAAGTGADVSNASGADLIEAAKLDDISEVRRILDQGVDVNARDEDGLTALHWAAFMKHLDVANLLIARGGRVDLFIAAGLDDVEAISELAAAGHDVNAGDFEGDTPLHWAVHGDNRRAVETLLALGADPTIRNNLDKTPIDHAREMTFSDIAMAFDAGAASAGVPRPVETEESADSTLIGNALIDASLYCNIDEAARLVQNGADVNFRDSYGWTPLHNAAFIGCAGVVRLLLDKRADVNARDDGRIPLHSAANGGNMDVVRLLVARGSDINAVDDGGITPLRCAVDAGFREMSDFLIAKGAAMDIFTAALLDRSDYIQRLVSRGARAGDVDAINNTALHYAASGCAPKAAAMLLSLKADPEARNILNATPLHLAAMNGCRPVAEILLKNGADINAVNDYNQTPADMADTWGHYDLLEFLRENGAKSLKPPPDDFSPE